MAEEVVAPTVEKNVLLSTKICPNCKMMKARLEAAGIDFEVLYAEEPMGAELAKAYDITTAPVLIVPTADGVELYRNVSEIIGFIG